MEKSQYDYLNAEREKLWGAVEKLCHSSETASQDITVLKEDVKKKTSEYGDEAKKSAIQAASNKTKTSNLLKEVKERKTEFDRCFDEIQSFKDTIPEINKLYNSAKGNSSEVEEIKLNIQKHANYITQSQEGTDKNLATAKESLEEVQETKENIDELKDTIDDLHQKTILAHSQAVKRNNEIKAVYDEIFGYTYEDEKGNEKTANGTKDELEQAYDVLNNKHESISTELDEFKKQKTTEYKEFLTQKNKETEELKNKIRSLLPEAMTAGLSHAFEKKREDEEGVLKASKTTFLWSIIALSATAVVPMMISGWFLYEGKAINDVILDLPKIVFSILPLYMPLFWFAMSANKNVKLSKRLIEEYSHKESLSKTFEGLSTQIDNIDDDEISSDLRTRLLYNIISASSENPGKLIKDFHSSDNPILNAIDKSLSFSKSLEKLSLIPGVEIILKKVIQRQEQRKDLIESSLEESVEVNNEKEDCDEDE